MALPQKAKSKLMVLANNTHNKDVNGFIPLHMFLPICFHFALDFNFSVFIEES